MKSLFIYTLSFMVILCVGLVRADALVVTQAMKASTIAEYDVDDSGVRLELEVGADDVKAFRNWISCFVRMQPQLSA